MFSSPGILILVIVTVVIVIMIIYAQYGSRASRVRRYRSRARTRLATLDTQQAREEVAREINDAPANADGDTVMNSDDAFTLALIQLHSAHDALDRNDMRAHGSAMDETRKLLTRALEMRRNEKERAINLKEVAHARADDRAFAHGDADHVTTDATLLARANDIEVHMMPRIATEVDRPHGVRNLFEVDRANIADEQFAQQLETALRESREQLMRTMHAQHGATPIVETRRAWTSDAENVHDSAVGDDVMRRIDFLREHDIHAIDKAMCAGYILRAMNINTDILESPNRATIQQNVRDVLRTIVSDAYCYRYKIGELEALRLVIERIYSTADTRVAHNIEASIIRALSDCIESSGISGSVCLVGRITRMIGALDIVDPGMPSLKTTDAYRAEIMQQLGRIMREKGEVTDTDIDSIMSPYAQVLPKHIFDAIRAEVSTT